jgi:FtsH-binding integral membrane protein
MNEQTPINAPEPMDRREARRQRRAERLADPSRGGSWVAGVILIVLGGAFLMQNMGSYRFPLQNWWALFILIPAVGAFDTAFRTYRNAGTFTNTARGSLLVGIVLTLVTAIFLFNLSWTYFGPALIILAGLGILFNSMFTSRDGGA